MVPLSLLPELVQVWPHSQPGRGMDSYNTKESWAFQHAVQHWIAQVGGEIRLAICQVHYVVAHCCTQLLGVQCKVFAGHAPLHPTRPPANLNPPQHTHHCHQWMEGGGRHLHSSVILTTGTSQQ